ncbi:M48 family metallopeptidase [Rhodococcus sp. D2-41]|nr:M48 family metallopeptidase [Rhodococcus sp. D2-41]
MEIRRSTRRRRTVSARREGETVVVLMPAGLSAQQESELVAEMIEKLERADRRAAQRSARSDDELARRTAELSVQWLDGRARPSSVRWVPPMRTRWASCTPSDRTIRVSELLRGVPPYVLDYVLVHELAHLLVAGGHTPQF